MIGRGVEGRLDLVAASGNLVDQTSAAQGQDFFDFTGAGAILQDI